MTDTAVDRFIAALKKKLRVRTDSQLAGALGIGKSTIASWRRRDTVPGKWRQELSLEHGLDFERFQRGALEDKHLSSVLLNAAFYLAVLRLGKALPDDKIADYASWLGEFDHRIRFLMTDGTSANELITNNPHVFTRIFMDVAGNKLATPQQIIDLRESDPNDEVLAQTRGFPT